MSSRQIFTLTNQMAGNAVALFAGCVTHVRDNEFHPCLLTHWLLGIDSSHPQWQHLPRPHGDDWPGIGLHGGAQQMDITLSETGRMPFLLLQSTWPSELGWPSGYELLGDRPRTQWELGMLLSGHGAFGCPVADAFMVEVHPTPTAAIASVLTVLYRSIIQGIRVLGIRVFLNGDRRLGSGKDDWILIHHPRVSILT